MAKKTISEVAKEVVAGKWGSGDTRKQNLIKAGYDYNQVQAQVNKMIQARTKTIAKMNTWAKKIANDNTYHYKLWTSDAKTHGCPICNKYPVGKYHGWNCIGYAWAIWHHGGGLPCKCNCYIIPNDTGNKLLATKTNAEALSIVKSRSGFNDIKIIKNKNGIPKSQWQAGDICLQYNGNTYVHTFYYMGDGKIADATGSNGKVPNDDQIKVRSYSKYSCKIIIRWVGASITIPAPAKPYQNLKAENYISDSCYIGQATSDERGKTTGGAAGDQTGKEVAISKWSYTSGSKYNSWKYVFRAKDSAARLKIAQAAIDACKNNHIGYDTGTGDRKTCFKAAQKVNFDLSKITTNCELTCSELANVCIAAAGLKSYLPVIKMAYVESLKAALLKSSEFVNYTDTAHVAKTTSLQPGDILISGSHTAIVVKIPKKVDSKKAYSSTLPTTKLTKTTAEVINDTIIWAKWIAGNNDFHYGYTSKDKKINAHHNGCYFCGTNKSQKKGMLMPEHTYCCNPFIGAAWAHGGCVPTALKLCRNNKSWSFDKGKGYDASSLFKNLGHPAKSALKAGDVLCKDGHVAMYIGNGKLVEAATSDDNKKNSTKWNNSIHVATLTDARYKGFARVHRFIGKVDTDMSICHGEVSKRVGQWQKFLNWYFDGKVGEADNIFGDNTLKWTKKFQETVMGKGQGDGIVGPKTLAAAKAVKK